MNLSEAPHYFYVPYSSDPQDGLKLVRFLYTQMKTKVILVYRKSSYRLEDISIQKTLQVEMEMVTISPKEVQKCQLKSIFSKIPEKVNYFYLLYSSTPSLAFNVSLCFCFLIEEEEKEKIRRQNSLNKKKNSLEFAVSKSIDIY